MRVYRFDIALKQELMLKGRSYDSREGILLERDGAWAEASPLPGFSLESIDDVIAALRGERDAPASLEFAFAALEQGEVTAAVPFNRLLLGDAESVVAGARSCAGNCAAVKLKVGQRDILADVELVKQVRAFLPEATSLRLDANQAWTLADAVTFIEGIRGINLEYIEEPLHDPQQLEELYTRTGVRYALDETLRGQNSLDAWPNAVAVICKPTILGGLEAIQRLTATGKPIVFSAAFESGVGIARIMQLAAAYSPGIPAGLDTLDWLTDDLLVRSPRKRDGVLMVNGMEIELKCLERVEL